VAQDRWEEQLTRVIACEIRRYRDAAGMSAQQLADRCAELGAPMHRSVIANLENGRRPSVSVAELLVLARALDVPPLRFLVPLENDTVELLPGEYRDPWTATNWLIDQGSDEMELLADYNAEERNLRTLLRASLNRGGWFIDGSELRMARNSYGSLLRIRQRMTSRGLAEPALPDDLREIMARPGFTNGAAVPAPTVGQQPVVAAIVTSRNGVLVGRRNDRIPPWTFIAGEVEPGERPEDAAIREVKEETTLEIRPGEVIGERDHPATGRHMIYLAAQSASLNTRIAVGDQAELAEVRWASLAEAEDLMPDMFGPARDYLARTLGGGAG
jgi:8-oxo-dGTP diphosphatase